MRIVSGKYKGRAINPPRNLRARPTTDFAKENLFNVLGNLLDFEECDVLDLFAGTGSISYEFASRGARSVTSVEINPVHYNFIRQTAAQLGIGNLYAVKANVFLYLKSCPKQFDVIFSDAPYDLESSEQVVRLVLENDLLRPEGVLDFRTFEEDELLRISGILAAKELRKRAVLVLPETVIIVGKEPRHQPPRQSGPLGGTGKTGIGQNRYRASPLLAEKSGSPAADTSQHTCRQAISYAPPAGQRKNRQHPRIRELPAKIRPIFRPAPLHTKKPATWSCRFFICRPRSAGGA